MFPFGEFLKTWSLRSNSVTRQVSFNRTKNVGKMPKSKKFKCDILSNFQTMCVHGKLRLPCMEFDPAIRTFFLWFLGNPEFFDSFWNPGKIAEMTKCRKTIPNKGQNKVHNKVVQIKFLLLKSPWRITFFSLKSLKIERLFSILDFLLFLIFMLWANVWNW